MLTRIKSFANRVYTSIRSTLANPSDWFLQMLSAGYKAKAGVDVNKDTALKISAVFACCDVIASTIAALPLSLFTRSPEGKEKVYNHPLAEIFDAIANSETTAFDFWTMLIFNLLLTGDGYAVIKRDGNGVIRELWNIPSSQVTVYRNSTTNELFYEVTDYNNNKVTYYPENIFRVRGQRFESDNPLDPINVAREAMGLAIALEEYAENYFANGANVGGIVQYEGSMKKDSFERFKTTFYEKYSGLKNSNKIIFLEDGAKFTPTSNSPEQSQSLEARKYQVIEIARFFKVPLNKIMDYERLTFNNAEQVNINFVQDCIVPMCVRIEQTIKKDLLTPSERKNVFPKFVVMGLLRGDVSARKEFYQAGIQNGWFSPNDVRELEDMNRYEGGDVYMVNGAMVPVYMLEAYLMQKGGKNGNGEKEN